MTVPFAPRPPKSARPLALLLCGLLALPAPVVLAQAPPPARADFSAALSGTSRPLTLKISDLDGTWRQVSIAKIGGADLLSLFAVSSRGGGGGPALDQYYTRGETTVIGGETYLVAYRYSLKLSDLSGDSGNTPPQITPETVITLSLVNVRQIASLDGIQAFVPVSAAQAQAQTDQVAEAQSENNLKQIGLGMIQYTQDADEKFPPMQSAEIAKKAIFPYVKTDLIFVHPRTHEPYRVNTSLSGHSLDEIVSPAQTVMYYEASAAPDGLRAVLFADGHVKRLPDAEWRRLLAASHLPSRTTTRMVPR